MIRLLAIGAILLNVPVRADEPPRVDRYGDPLPPGAIARMGTIRLRHVAKFGNGIGADFSPDGKSIVSNNEVEIRLWDTATGKLRWQFETEWSIGAVCFSPDGKLIAATSGAGLLLLDTLTGKQLRCLSPKMKSSWPLVFSHDGRTLATRAADETEPDKAAPPRGIELWDVVTGKSVIVLPTDNQMTLRSPAFSLDDKTLIVCGAIRNNAWRHQVTRWDLATRKVIAKVEFDGYGGVVAPDGRTVAVRHRPGQMHLYDTENGEDRGEIDDKVSNYTFTVDGRRLLSCRYFPESRSSTLSLWDVQTLKRLKTCTLTIGYPGRGIELSPDGRTVLCSFITDVFALVDLNTGRKILEFDSHDGPMSGIEFAPDGQTLYSGGDAAIRSWNPLTGEQRRMIPLIHNVTSLDVRPDGRELLVGGGEVPQRFNSSTGVEGKPLAMPQLAEFAAGDRATVQHVHYAEDGRSALGSYAIARIGRAASFGVPWYLWNPITAQPHRYNLLPPESQPVGFSPDGSRLVNWSVEHARYRQPSDPTSKVSFRPIDESWTVLTVRDAQTGRIRARLRQPDQFQFSSAFSRDGQTIATVTARYDSASTKLPESVDLRLWELRTAQERHSISLKPNQFFDPLAVAFAPDARTLVLSRRSCRLEFLDAVTGSELASRGGFDTTTQQITFRPDGKLLATGHLDGTVLSWDMTGIQPPKVDSTPLDAAALDAQWADLAGDDARKAYRAICDLAARPDQAVPLVAKRVKPADAKLLDRIRDHVRDLDSNVFRTRQAALKELTELADQVEPYLRELVNGNVTAEQRQQIQRLLDEPESVRSPEELRALRSIELLERIGTKPAGDVLRALAAGPSAVRLNREAKAALGRLTKRQLPNS